MSKQQISRRRFLGTGAAAGAGAIAAGTAPGVPAAPSVTRRADVVVVGGGFAGLTAARELVRRGKSVILLEARRRTGGRALNQKIVGGEVSERGATFVGPTQDHIRKLAKDVGVKEFEAWLEGNNVYYADGMRSTYDNTAPTGDAPPDPLILGDLATVVTRLDEMSTHVSVNAPWAADSAAEWDGQTLETWIKDNSASPRFHQIVPVATRPIFGCEPRDISLLFTLFYIAASGNEENVGTFERNFNSRDGAQNFRFHGGTQEITNRITKSLGNRVVLGAAVKRITQDSRGVHVFTDRLRVDAKRVIVAIPPTLAGRIDYSPTLPSPRDQLMQRSPQGYMVKIAAVYDKAFWRDDGLNGTAVSLEGPVNVTFDDAPPDGTPGALIGFVGGDEARKFVRMSRSARRAAVVENLVTYFGSKAAKPLQYFESNWAREEWNRGCPVAVLGPGTLLRYGPEIRKPVGRVHWAGAETSTYWNGYMDGAVRSGKRAASEVLARL